MVEKVKFLFGINRIDDAPVKVYKDRSYDRFGLKDRIVAGIDFYFDGEEFEYLEGSEGPLSRMTPEELMAIILGGRPQA